MFIIAGLEKKITVLFAYLDMVGPKHNPATETVPQVDYCHTTAETNDIGEGNPHGYNENLGRYQGKKGEWKKYSPVQDMHGQDPDKPCTF